MFSGEVVFAFYMKRPQKGKIKTTLLTGGFPMERLITVERLQGFAAYLRQEECSTGTVLKYYRDLRTFMAWLEGRPVTKERVKEWKSALLEQGYAAVTINSMLAAVHRFLTLTGWIDCRVKYLKIQRRLFRDKKRELCREDYDRLVSAARGRGQERLALLLEAITATGIRVSEVQYITVEAAKQGRAEIALKGKIRTILLSSKLCRKLLKYAQKEKIASGEIFISGSGKSLGRRQIWAEMKRLCRYAGVEVEKVFPHNLRHLFATAYYRIYKDIARLADVLGHSSIETTRIYLLTSGSEHARQLDRLGLVS